jgi:hypothetical protein
MRRLPGTMVAQQGSTMGDYAEVVHCDQATFQSP